MVICGHYCCGNMLNQYVNVKYDYTNSLKSFPNLHFLYAVQDFFYIVQKFASLNRVTDSDQTLVLISL